MPAGRTPPFSFKNPVPKGGPDLLLVLGLVQFCKNPPAGKELIMAPLFGNPVLGDDNNPVSIANGRQPVRNDKRCPVFCQFIQCRLDLPFGFRIKGRRRLIQD